MSAPGDPWTSALESLAALRARWPGSEWTWDGRLACAVSSFPIAQEPEARRELAAEFPSEWTAETLPSAPGVRAFDWAPLRTWTCPRCSHESETREASPGCGACGLRVDE